MYIREEDTKKDDNTLWIGVAIVTVLEIAFWLLFYWIHTKIRP